MSWRPFAPLAGGAWGRLRVSGRDLTLALGLGGGRGLGAGEWGGAGLGRVPLERVFRDLAGSWARAWGRLGRVAGSLVWIGAHLEFVLGDHVVVDQRVQQREGAVHGHGYLRAVQPQEAAQRRVPTGPGLAHHCRVGDTGLGSRSPRLGSRGLGVPLDLWGV